MLDAFSHESSSPINLKEGKNLINTLMKNSNERCLTQLSFKLSTFFIEVNYINDSNFVSYALW